MKALSSDLRERSHLRERWIGQEQEYWFLKSRPCSTTSSCVLELTIYFCHVWSCLDRKQSSGDQEVEVSWVGHTARVCVEVAESGHGSCMLPFGVHELR